MSADSEMSKRSATGATPSVSASTETGPIARCVGSLISSALDPRKRRPRSTDQSKPTAKSASSLAGPRMVPRKPSASEKSMVSLPPCRSPPIPRSPVADPAAASQASSVAAYRPMLCARTPMPPATARRVSTSPGAASRVTPTRARPWTAADGRAEISPGGRSSIASPPATSASSRASRPRGRRELDGHRPAAGERRGERDDQPARAGAGGGGDGRAEEGEHRRGGRVVVADGEAEGAGQVGEAAQQLAAVEGRVAPAEEGAQRVVGVADDLADAVEADPAGQVGAGAAGVGQRHPVDDAGQAEGGERRSGARPRASGPASRTAAGRRAGRRRPTRRRGRRRRPGRRAAGWRRCRWR